MQTNSVFDGFKTQNSHFTLEVDRCMKQLTNIQLEIDTLEGLEMCADNFLKLDRLHNMKHLLCVRAYNYQLEYLKRADEKRLELARDEGVQETIMEKTRKAQEKILKSIKASSMRMEDRPPPKRRQPPQQVDFIPVSDTDG